MKFVTFHPCPFPNSKFFSWAFTQSNHVVIISSHYMHILSILLMQTLENVKPDSCLSCADSGCDKLMLATWHMNSASHNHCQFFLSILPSPISFLSLRYLMQNADLYARNIGINSVQGVFLFVCMVIIYFPYASHLFPSLASSAFSCQPHFREQEIQPSISVQHKIAYTKIQRL